MGLEFRSLRIRVICICMLLSLWMNVEAQTLSARGLDVILQDSAYRAFVRPRTGVEYNGIPPLNLSGIQISAMRLRSGSLFTREPILIEFTQLNKVPDDAASLPKCVSFDLNGVMNFTNVTSGNKCVTYTQGHFSIVVESNGTSPVLVPPPPPPPQRSHGGKGNGSKGGIIVGSVAGGIALLAFNSVKNPSASAVAGEATDNRTVSDIMGDEIGEETIEGAGEMRSEPDDHSASFPPKPRLLTPIPRPSSPAVKPSSPAAGSSSSALAMLPSISASMAEVAAMSDSAFCKRFRSSCESSPSLSSPDLSLRKGYRGMFKLKLDTDSERDELGDEDDDEVEESSDSDSESKDVEDEGPIAEDEDPAAGDEGFTAGDEGL
nr:hypothetical protein CTI12_AA277210 [Tanacetum cinerariifolium]